MNADPTRIDLRHDPRHRRIEGVAIHGDTPFSVPLISRIDDNLWTGGCMNGLVLPGDIDHVVSLYPWEAYRQRHEVRSWMAVRLYDAEDDVDRPLIYSIARWVNDRRRDGVVLVHCQAGLNRSALVAGLALVLDGMRPADAIALLREKRSPAVLCNRGFEKWLLAQEAA